MQRINNWENVKARTERSQLPLGAYVCRIMGAEEKTYAGKNGEFKKLEVSIDIYEGEYSNFYADDYRAQQREDKRWGGVVRLYVPTDDGSERDEWTKSTFKGFTEAVEDSNSGYHWDWNEKGLKNKIVGVVFRNEEWEFNGNSGWKVRPFRFIAADAVRSGDYKLPQDKPLSRTGGMQSQANTAPVSDFSAIEDEDLPF